MNERESVLGIIRNSLYIAALLAVIIAIAWWGFAKKETTTETISLENFTGRIMPAQKFYSLNEHLPRMVIERPFEEALKASENDAIMTYNNSEIVIYKPDPITFGIYVFSCLKLDTSRKPEIEVNRDSIIIIYSKVHELLYFLALIVVIILIVCICLIAFIPLSNSIDMFKMQRKMNEEKIRREQEKRLINTPHS